MAHTGKYSVCKHLGHARAASASRRFAWVVGASGLALCMDVDAGRGACLSCLDSCQSTVRAADYTPRQACNEHGLFCLRSWPQLLLLISLIRKTNA